MDFSQESDDVSTGVSLVATKVLEHGVTSFCPTLVTSPPAVYHKVTTSPAVFPLITRYTLTATQVLIVAVGDARSRGRRGLLLLLLFRFSASPFSLLSVTTSPP